jgi:hypothetical protein
MSRKCQYSLIMGPTFYILARGQHTLHMLRVAVLCAWLTIADGSQQLTLPIQTWKTAETGFILQRIKEILSFSSLLDRLWNLPSAICIEYGRQSSQNIKLTTYFHLGPKDKKIETYLHFPVTFHGSAYIRSRH